MIYLQLLIVYLKIGLFGFGGGYAMLSLIQNEVVEQHQWLTDTQFTDIVAISQMTPGPVGINSATYIGYTVTGGNVFGSVVATFAICFPSFVLMLLVSRLLVKFKTNPWVEALFTGLRPAIVGLIAAAALSLMTVQNFPDWKSVVLCAAAFVSVKYLKVHPIMMIIIAGVIGYLFFKPTPVEETQQLVQLLGAR
jgi:chromate transporter